MKKFSKKGVLLFAGAMAVCAFVLPAVSSAANWDAVGSHHTLDSPDIGFTSTGGAGVLDSSCANSFFTTRVDSASVLTITAGAFRNCTADAPLFAAHCIATWTPTNFPWIATAVTTTNIQIHGIDVDVRFENFSTGGCTPLNGAQTRITGTLTGGTWDIARREANFVNAEGVVTHPGAARITVRGTFRSTGNGLLVLD